MARQPREKVEQAGIEHGMHLVESVRVRRLQAGHQRELDRKDKKLRAAEALLDLQKKVREIWGDGDDDTGTRSGT